MISYPSIETETQQCQYSSWGQGINYGYQPFPQFQYPYQDQCQYQYSYAYNQMPNNCYSYDYSNGGYPVISQGFNNYPTLHNYQQQMPNSYENSMGYHQNQTWQQNKDNFK